MDKNETKRTISINKDEINTIIQDLQRILQYHPMYETEFITGIIHFLLSDGCISIKQQYKLQHIYKEKYVTENQDLIDALNKPKDTTLELINKLTGKMA